MVGLALTPSWKARTHDVYSYFSYIILLYIIAEPKMIVIDHDYSKRPLQLFWMDGVALQAIAGQEEETTLLTEIATSNTTVGEETTASPSTSSGTQKYPRRPALETLAEFKTTPAIHAGYAVTWYGLSVAGVYMTRKLITRGR
jgi:hypothetical protein